MAAPGPASPPAARQLQSALRDLAFAVHALQLYPTDSPVVHEAIAKAHASFGPLLGEERLSLKVHPDTIRVDDDNVQRGRAIRELAERLHQRGVAHLHLDDELTPTTLGHLARLLATDYETLREKGGIDAARADFDMPGLAFEMLQLERLYEEAGEGGGAAGDGVWDRILESYRASAGTDSLDWESLARQPERLGAFLDWLFDDERADEGVSEVSRIHMVRAVCERAGEAAARLGKAEFDAVSRVFGDFYESLDKEVWIDLISQRLPVDGQLDDADDLELADEETDMSRNIGACLGNDQVQDLLVYALGSRDTVSPRIVGLFRRLLQDRPDRDELQQAIRATLERQAGPDEDPSRFDDLWPQLNEVLQGETPDAYVSATYRASLDRLLVEGASAEVWDMAKIGPRLDELRPAYVVQRKAKIMLAVLPSAIDDEEYTLLARELERTLPELVVDGQYIAAEEVLNSFSTHLAPDSGRTDEQRATARTILVRFCNQHTLREVVRNLAGRQRTQIDAATRIFATLGSMAVPALLEALAEERSRALRAHLVRMLAAVGDSALPEIRKHLRDKRWFFVRNLVWIIGEVGADSLIPHLGEIVDHSDPRVRREVVRAATKLDDESAAALLLKAVDDDDIDVRLLAIRGIGLSHATVGAERIVELLELPNGRGQNTEIIRAAAVALGRIGHTAALETLRRVARKPLLFRRRRIEAADAAAWAVASLRGETRDDAPETLPSAASDGGVRRAGPSAANRASAPSRT